jgi:hypothetical protein
MDNRSNTPPSTLVQQSVREAFEKWIRYESKLASRFFGLLMRKSEDEYHHEDVQLLWLSYQAALSTSPLLDKNDQAEGEREALSKDAILTAAKEAGFTVIESRPERKLSSIRTNQHADITDKIIRLVRGLENMLALPPPDSNELVEVLRRLEVSANTVDYCYRSNPGNFASALAGLVESAERARAALAQSPSVGLNTKSSERG